MEGQLTSKNWAVGYKMTGRKLTERNESKRHHGGDVRYFTSGKIVIASMSGARLQISV